jgi:hypothetical protein
VSTELLEEKLRMMVSPRYGAAIAERAIGAVNALERCPDLATAFTGWVPNAVTV